MTPKPFFSIIIPALNEIKALPLLLSDLAAQTMTDFEVILIDGHSEDGTVAAAQKFAARLPRLAIHESPKRQVCFQRNLGAKMAQAYWLLFMDADNRLPPYFLQGLKYQIEVNEPDLFTTHTLPDSDDTKDQAISTIINLYLELQKNTAHPSILESMIGIQIPVFQALKGFNESLQWGEGGYLIEAAHKQHYRYAVFKEPAYVYSLRRLKKQGTLKTARTSASLELARIFNLKLNQSTVSRLYPMQGGALKASKKASPIERILGEFHSIKPLGKTRFADTRAKLKALFNKLSV